MNEHLDSNKVQADVLELPERLLNRLSLAEEEIEGFDKDSFVTEAVRKQLESLEKKNGKVIAWDIKPFYFNDESL
jgi:hypothetical protein